MSNKRTHDVVESIEPGPTEPSPHADPNGAGVSPEADGFAEAFEDLDSETKHHVLRELIDDLGNYDHPQLAIVAAEMLGDLGGCAKFAVPSLIWAMRRQVDEVSQAARDALAKIRRRTAN
ncbi:hypothetical protein Pan216_35060 [Planctomycetes bacterium Pan216]|uniref:HEAT repeat protein n=1 Tax=Kolteria novifilia TaxID=2527975 RepID=A0A518B6N8_9BACT|nr:hypothetical protein Pan216_35060 [Planctomycetes bacterium Pan216]